MAPRLPAPGKGFPAPDFTLDLLDGGQDRPASRRIFLWSEYRHPIRVYEILAALGIFLFTMKLPLAKSGRGLNFSLAIALSAGARLLLEAFRGESLIWPGGIRAAQAVSLIILGISLRLMRAWSQSQIQSQAQTDWLSPIARLCKPFAGRCQLAIFLGAGRGLGLRVGSHGADPHRSQPL